MACKQHAVAIPLPAQGHINSLMRLCKKLASQGFTITFVNIDPIHHRIEELEVGVEEEGTEDRKLEKALDIRRAHVPIHGLDLSNDYRFSFVHFFEAMQGLAPHLEQLLFRLTSTPQEPPVTCLISDFYMTGPSHQLAHKFNLPRIVFYPFTPSMLLFMDYVLHGDISQNEVVDAVTKGAEKGVFCGGLPGLPTINTRDLPSFKHVEDNNEYMYELTRKELQESIKGGHAIVVNSFKEAEEGAMKELAARMKVAVYPVGPMVEALQEKESATSLWKEDRGCMNWLDKQAPLSVLYISFGSITLLSRPQFEELVAGLLSSNHHFLFSFRPDLVKDSPNCGPSPVELLLSSGKGYVAEWTPQTSVLAHPSVGGFLTHCGLNSMMEALAQGVPMLCWPYFVDQFMNAKFVVEEWQVGLHFWSHNEPYASFVTRDEVQKTVNALMEGEDGKAIRKNAERLQQIVRQSLSPGGTSCKGLQDFIQSLS